MSSKKPGIGPLVTSWIHNGWLRDDGMTVLGEGWAYESLQWRRKSEGGDEGMVSRTIEIDTRERRRRTSS